MGSVKSYNNGTLMKLTPKSARLGGLVAGINPDEAVTMAQFNALQDGTVDVSRVELAEDGTAAAPVITWDGDTDTGFYRIGANNIGFSANGSKVLDMGVSGGVTGFAVTGVISATTTVTAGTLTKTGDGAVDAPSLTFTSDVDTGIYRIGANNIGVACNGAKVLDIGTAGLGVTGTLDTTGVTTFGAGNVYKSLTTQTALAGGAQAGTALTAEYMNFTVVATALDSAQLPTPVLGTRRIVQNSAVLPMAVFGQTGASIDGGAANASVVVMPGQTVTFNATSATTWKSNVGNLDKASMTITQEVTLTATEIVGTDAGDLGHANGAVLIPGVSSAYAMEFVSATLIYDFDTAAYTGGADDLVVCLSGGGATLSGATTAANLLGAAGDKIVVVYPLTTAGLAWSVGTGINLKSTAWTQPGTAAGVLRCQITYRLHKTGL